MTPTGAAYSAERRTVDQLIKRPEALIQATAAYVAELPGTWAMNRRQEQLMMEDLKYETAYYSSYYQHQINQCQDWKNRSGPFAAELAVARLIDRKLDLLKDKLKLEELLVARKLS